MERGITNNVVNVEGKVVTPFTFSHVVFDEEFYTATLDVPRLSENHDNIIILVSKRLIDVNMDTTGVKIRVRGQFRSYNHHDGVKNRLVLSVFVREIEILGNNGIFDGTKNKIYLDGFVCKPPIYRKTPLGREITDILVAVNRPYGKTDYIPCIAWGRNARFSSGFGVGTQVELWGRIQSREYTKKLSDTDIKPEKRVAIEVSINQINEVPYFSERQTDEEDTQKSMKGMVS